MTDDLPAAEVALERRLAVRRLEATGATRAEAEAAVDEELRHALTPVVPHLEACAAAALDAIGQAWDALRPSLEALTNAYLNRWALGFYREAVEGHDHDPPAGDPWRRALERKRSGAGSGPPAGRLDRRAS